MGRFKDAFVHSRAPFVDIPSNCVLLCLDPDAPIRNENGSKTGKFGPRLHWFKKGQENIVKYKGPAPLQGIHRYIFVLFEEIKKMKMPKSLERKSWNAKKFITENKGRLRPLKINFFYCSANE